MHCNLYINGVDKATKNLLVDIPEIFFKFRVRDEKNKQKSSINDQLTGHFQSSFFLISPEKTVKLVR